MPHKSICGYVAIRSERNRNRPFLALHGDEQLDCLPQVMVTAALGSGEEHQRTCFPPVLSSRHCYQPQTWDICGLNFPVLMSEGPVTLCYQSSAEILSCWRADTIMCCIPSLEDQVSQRKQEQSPNVELPPSLISLQTCHVHKSPFPPGLSSHSTDHSS